MLDLAARFIGIPYEEALQKAKLYDFYIRIASTNGHEHRTPDEYNPNRINLDLRNNIVEKAYLG